MNCIECFAVYEMVVGGCMFSQNLAVENYIVGVLVVHNKHFDWDTVVVDDIVVDVVGMVMVDSYTDHFHC